MPVWNTPVVLDIRLDPIVKEDEFTPVDTFAEPDTSRLTTGDVIPIPILLLIESINNVPESKLTLPETVCKVPFRVALFTVVFPDTVTSPLKLPVFADITNLPVLLPSSIVFDVGTRTVALATKPVVVKLDELITPV